jgi:hypothetical protein
VALRNYNQQAVLVERPELDWKTVVEYTFLAQFDLLHFGCRDIRDEQWAQPGMREATTLFFKLRGAHDEIARCNIEIRRLSTSIRDERVDIPKHIERVSATNAALGFHTKWWWELREAVNRVHDYRLTQIRRLVGYRGWGNHGRRLHRRHSLGQHAGADIPDAPETAGMDDDMMVNEDDQIRELGESLDHWEESLS